MSRFGFHKLVLWSWFNVSEETIIMALSQTAYLNSRMKWISRINIALVIFLTERNAWELGFLVPKRCYVPSDYLGCLQEKLRLELEATLVHEEQFWRQKSWVSWLREGEQNTCFFHLKTLYQTKKKSYHATSKLGRAMVWWWGGATKNSSGVLRDTVYTGIVYAVLLVQLDVSNTTSHRSFLAQPGCRFIGD